MPVPISSWINRHRLWGTGKSTVKQKIFEWLDKGHERAQNQMTKQEKCKYKKEANRRWWFNFFGLGDFVTVEPDLTYEEGVIHIPLDLNAWVFNGTGNEWASILIEVT